jgi:hypothetical protein
MCRGGNLGLMLVAGQAGAEDGGQVGVLLFVGDLKGLLGDGDSQRIVAGLGIHGGEHLKDRGFAVAGEFCSSFELWQSFSESVASVVVQGD